MTWLFAPVVVFWWLFSLALFLISFRKRPRKTGAIIDVQIGLASIAMALLLLHPPLTYEFVFKLIEPKECSRDIKPVRTVLLLPDGKPELYESIVALPDGSFVVTAATRGELLSVGKDGTINILASLPTGRFDLRTFNGMLGGIVQGQDKALYTIVLATDLQNRGLWRVDQAGNSSLWARLPMDASGNGLTLDHHGNFYIADSRQGLVWKVEANGGPPVIWYQGPLIGAGARSLLPTANGIKFTQLAIFVTNTKHKRVVRIDIREDGSAGEASIWDEGIPADDFAIDDHGRLYLTTHPFNTVVQLQRDKPCLIVAAVDSGIAGPTAAVIGRGSDDRSLLYVLNDGGYSRAVKGGKPSIIGLEIN